MVTDTEMDEALASGCESGAELSLGLNDGSDSEFDEDPEPRPSRFVSESAAAVSDCPDPADGAARIRIADVSVLVADPVLTGWKPRYKVGVRRGVGTGSSESQRRLGGITAV